MAGCIILFLYGMQVTLFQVFSHCIFSGQFLVQSHTELFLVPGETYLKGIKQYSIKIAYCVYSSFTSLVCWLKSDSHYCSEKLPSLCRTTERQQCIGSPARVWALIGMHGCTVCDVCLLPADDRAHYCLRHTAQSVVFLGKPHDRR